MSANDTLGKVFVSQEELLKGDGQREEFKLEESASKNKKQPVSNACGRGTQIVVALISRFFKTCRVGLFYAFERPLRRTCYSWSVSCPLRRPVSLAFMEMKPLCSLI